MQERSVVVTGAAAGIGRALARRFHGAGYVVGAYDVDADGLAGLAEELPGLATDVLDVRDPEAWRARLSDFTARTDGRLDVLVNNAGVLRGGPFTDIRPADHRLMVDVNVTGVLNGCYAAHPYLLATPGATVVNLASASAIYGQAELATYSATKFAVRGLTEALEIEWAPDDIRVRAVWPLFVRTAMTEGLDIGSTRSLGVRLTAEDVAEEVLDVVASRRRPLAGVHRAVGRQAKVLLASSGLAPAWVLRQVNARIAR